MDSAYETYLRPLQAQAARWCDELVTLAAINSGSFNVQGVNRVGERICSLFAPLAPTVERLPVAPYQSTGDDGRRVERPLGHAWRLRKRADAPLRVLLCGHLDTVFGIDHPFQNVDAPESGILRGPGVADLKGGLLVMLQALQVLETSPWAERIGWDVLLIPDEEIGSRSSAGLLGEAAKENHLGLIYEPATADGQLAGARKGSGNFDVVAHGRAAHAGREHALGRNAIRAAADFIAALDRLNGQREGVTINPGYVHGGGALNVVPETCVFKFNVRTACAGDECWMQEQLDRLLMDVQAQDGFNIELRGGFTRPPKPFDGQTRVLADMIADCGRSLGLALTFRPTGGCCDGNNLAAAGLPNVDTLGVVGGEIHSDREYMQVHSLTERAQLSALLLLRLASGELDWSSHRQSPWSDT